MNAPKLDRSAARQNPDALAERKNAARGSYERILTDVHVVFDPTTPSEDVHGIGTLADTEKQLRSDWEWVAGYERGLQDATNSRDKLEPVGPGITGRSEGRLVSIGRAT